MFMIITFETVYKELEDLFINLLPGYIEKENKSHNDGFFIKSFENKTLNEECLKFPCFNFKIEETEYTEKDRIIENTIFDVSFEIKIKQNYKCNTFEFWHYIHAIYTMFEETEHNSIYKITRIKDKKIFIKITAIPNSIV